MEPNNQLTRTEDANADSLMRRATDVAGVCKAIVAKTALTIQGRKFIRVEGWQSITATYGCILSARDVERIPGGVRAIGEVRRVSDGRILATAEGFVGEDEPTWFGGEMETRQGKKTLPKRADYAIRAMAQSRAMSRAGRTAFAFVVVLMDAGFDTTPAEEVPEDGFDHSDPGTMPTRQEARQEAISADDWREVEIHFGKLGPDREKNKPGLKLGELDDRNLRWWCESWTPKPDPKNNMITASDLFLRKALDTASIELGFVSPPKATR